MAPNRSTGPKLDNNGFPPLPSLRPSTHRPSLKTSCAWSLEETANTTRTFYNIQLSPRICMDSPMNRATACPRQRSHSGSSLQVATPSR
ncbi:uncharacterized protein ARMOST_19904 [Armillaria ostoyae]|uniref:Uncharacterized protein n=1 Tax=Armillaria ostoyae TaxID=47428 RepID=A0A284S5U1_ARMOS|nr:uncharacterized protein ARMOST_19904 [Armillaria ostoyae]